MKVNTELTHYLIFMSFQKAGQEGAVRGAVLQIEWQKIRK